MNEIQPERRRKSSAIRQLLLGVPAASLGQGISPRTAVGFSLLYSSAYFLPPLGPSGSYLLPSHNLLALIFLPSAVAVAALLAVFYFIRTVGHRVGPSLLSTPLTVVGLSLFFLIGIKGVFEAAGYDWREVIWRSKDIASTTNHVKYLVWLAVVVVLWATRRHLGNWTRLLSSLGFAFATLAVLKVLLLVGGGSQDGHEGSKQIQGAPAVEARPAAEVGASTSRSRRVVWVIFDETDFEKVFLDDSFAHRVLPNFKLLSERAVFATHAETPASATIYSIPALLTATPLSGSGVRIGKGAALSLEPPTGRLLPFIESNTIFGSLKRKGESASILGFYHPYCKLFNVAQCDSFPWPNVGKPTGALLANLPDFLGPPAWDQITEDQLRLLPKYLARDDALTFIHLNFPHLPADYADRALHLTPSKDPLVEYSHNLQFADQVLGEIVRDLQGRTASHELLLVVSTDHWLRNRWYRAGNKDTSRLVPFFAWKVGDPTGVAISEPLNTVHTAEMIVSFLDGAISSQPDIATWWKNQPLFPPYIAPST